MEQYYERIYPLIYGGSDYKNRLAYQIYDGGNKGSISSVDLEEFFQKILPCQQRNKVYIPCQCPFYLEVKQLSDVYINHNIL